MPHGFTTVGYWEFAGLMNSGALQVYCAPLSKKRYRVAVIGHELVEAFYCWWFNITTEECDKWDAKFERKYAEGLAAVEVEPGDDPMCPYHRGHWLGCIWERLAIWCSFAGWSQYVSECESIYHGMKNEPTKSRKTLP